MTLCLAEGVHWCIANDRIVLLDLKGDSYSCLPPPVDQAWRRRWAGETLNATDTDALAALVKTGLLPDIGTLTPPPGTNTVTRSLLEALDTDSASVSPNAVFHQVRTAVALKTTSLFALIAAVQKRKLACELSDQTVTDTARRDIARFMASRRLLSRQSQCLRTSLALVSLLAERRYFPDLVIGVRMRPFAAHAWVQVGDMVLNDTVDEVAPFTPILVV
jgi:hypothetical protein